MPAELAVAAAANQRTGRSAMGIGHVAFLDVEMSRVSFLPLPGAEAEARSVASLLGGDCVLRIGPDAREAELKAAVSPRVLHLATHGFFLSDQEFRRTNSLPLG